MNIVIIRYNSIIDSPRPCSAYIYRDADGVMLYVGISTAPWHRMMQHREDSKWFHLVASLEWKWFGCEIDARRFENDNIPLSLYNHRIFSKLRYADDYIKVRDYYENRTRRRPRKRLRRIHAASHKT